MRNLGFPKVSAALPGRAGLVVVLTLLTGCGSGGRPVVYEDDQGFHFLPPPGWSERVRATDSAAGAQPPPGRQPSPPLPPLGVPALLSQERLLARYDRPSAGRLAWLRVTTADVAPSIALEECLAARPPGPGWRCGEKVQSLVVAGQPAARIVFAGRWSEHQYSNETVAVRKGEKAYFLTASFPASDDTAREQVREAIAGATWP